MAKRRRSSVKPNFQNLRSPAPEGFQWVPWANVHAGEIVYLAAYADDVDGLVAHGPLVVTTTTGHTVRTPSGETYTVREEMVLYKIGPKAVVVLDNGSYIGLYADFPCDVAVVDISGTPRRTRSLTLDAVSDDVNRQAAELYGCTAWKGLFGAYTVVEAAALLPDKPKAVYRVTGQLGAGQLAMQLLRSCIPFECVLEDEHVYCFRMDRRYREQLDDLLPDQLQVKE